MKAATSVLVGALLAVAANAAPTVDETYPYTGPDVPIGDWVDPTINGDGTGFPRLHEPPAVMPKTNSPTNNVNVIHISYLPTGMTVHYQTPFGLGEAPSVKWGMNPWALTQTAVGVTDTYDRTPPCSLVAVTQCSQFFHNVAIKGLKPGTTYYYQIPAANGTTESDIESFTTAIAPGDDTSFKMAVVGDMGYTNAGGTYKYLLQAVEDHEVSFTWHGGDLSYADDWYSGILPCESDWPVCYNGTSTELPGSGAIPPEYLVPLPEGEVANQGGPQGGDMNVIYESNWDLWQQWMNTITTKIPYMVLPGNHEASCAEFDGGDNVMTAYLNDDEANSTAPESALTYYSCPPSQRNFTAFQHRFHMAGEETGGVGNFWYSYDYGLVHFISLDGETDYPYSPEWPFVRDLSTGETTPTPAETYPTDSGPFGDIDGSWKTKENYEQYNWLVQDLQSVDRCKTPWVFVMSHRPMYSSETSSYQSNVRKAFEALLLQYGVDAYLAGHIHWYERMFPMSPNSVIDKASIINNNTYMTNPGVSMTHLVSGMGGNVESHSTLDPSKVLPLTAHLDQENYGFTKLHVLNSTMVTWSFIQGNTGEVGDEVTLLKAVNASCPAPPTSSSCSPSSTIMSSTASSSMSSSMSTSSSTSTRRTSTITTCTGTGSTGVPSNSMNSTTSTSMPGSVTSSVGTVSTGMPTSSLNSTTSSMPGTVSSSVGTVSTGMPTSSMNSTTSSMPGTVSSSVGTVSTGMPTSSMNSTSTRRTSTITTCTGTGTTSVPINSMNSTMSSSMPGSVSSSVSSSMPTGSMNSTTSSMPGTVSSSVGTVSTGMPTSSMNSTSTRRTSTLTTCTGTGSMSSSMPTGSMNSTMSSSMPGSVTSSMPGTVSSGLPSNSMNSSIILSSTMTVATSSIMTGSMSSSMTGSMSSTMMSGSVSTGTATGSMSSSTVMSGSVSTGTATGSMSSSTVMSGSVSTGTATGSMSGSVSTGTATGSMSSSTMMSGSASTGTATGSATPTTTGGVSPVTGTESGMTSSTATMVVSTITDVVTSYTTYCPGATTFTQGSSTYTVTAPTTLTITDCPCTISYTVTTTPAAPATTETVVLTGSSSATAVTSAVSEASSGTPGVPSVATSVVTTAETSPVDTTTVMSTETVMTTAPSSTTMVGTVTVTPVGTGSMTGPSASSTAPFFNSAPRQTIAGPAAILAGLVGVAALLL